MSAKIGKLNLPQGYLFAPRILEEMHNCSLCYASNAIYKLSDQINYMVMCENCVNIIIRDNSEIHGRHGTIYPIKQLSNKYFKQRNTNHNATTNKSLLGKNIWADIPNMFNDKENVV